MNNVRITAFKCGLRMGRGQGCYRLRFVRIAPLYRFTSGAFRTRRTRRPNAALQRGGRGPISGRGLVEKSRQACVHPLPGGLETTGGGLLVGGNVQRVLQVVVDVVDVRSNDDGVLNYIRIARNRRHRERGRFLLAEFGVQLRLEVVVERELRVAVDCVIGVLLHQRVGRGYRGRGGRGFVAAIAIRYAVVVAGRTGLPGSFHGALVLHERTGHRTGRRAGMRVSVRGGAISRGVSFRFSQSGGILQFAEHVVNRFSGVLYDVYTRIDFCERISISSSIIHASISHASISHAPITHASVSRISIRNVFFSYSFINHHLYNNSFFVLDILFSFTGGEQFKPR